MAGRELTEQQKKNKGRVDTAIGMGWAVPKQCNEKEGWIHYQVVGGTYDGAKLRLYPEFAESYTFNGEEYVVAPPKDRRTDKMTLRRVTP